MSISKEEILGMSTRHAWLRNRVKEILESLRKLEKVDDWELYRKMANELSAELQYATTEWEKCYQM